MQPDLIPIHPRLSEPCDLYALLDLYPGATQHEVDASYLKYTQTQQRFELKAYVAWKVLRDPFYANVYQEKRSLIYLYEAGFFVDQLSYQQVQQLEAAQQLFTTPVHKITTRLERMPAQQHPVVLLSTGSFSPVHAGHLAMLTAAKHTLETHGYHVLGAYLSPSHDAYVGKKYTGGAALNAAQRIQLCQATVQDSDWLMVDPWEAQYVPQAVNFTDVIVRLKNYLRHYLPTHVPVEIAYVFGSDNAAFARTFLHQGLSICVERTQAPSAATRNEAGLQQNPRIFFITQAQEAAGISSTKIREQTQAARPALSDGATTPARAYVIRDEGAWALQPWAHKISLDTLINAQQKFKEQLVSAIQAAYAASDRSLSPAIELRTYALAPQAAYAQQLAQTHPLINLDTCTDAGVKINMSRQFALSDAQLSSDLLIPRPGFPPLSEQFKDLKPGRYWLLDDDSVSGHTLQLIKKILPAEVIIEKFYTLTGYSTQIHQDKFPQTPPALIHDVVDLRDFLIGAKASGLVVALPNGTIARAPYLQPYVSLIARASIPTAGASDLSKQLWKMNLDFFSSLPQPLYLRDLDPYVRNLFYFLGFKDDMSVVELCEWHLGLAQPF